MDEKNEIKNSEEVIVKKPSYSSLIRLWLGLALGAAVLILFIIVGASGGDFIIGLFAGIFGFCFVGSCFFEDSAVREVMGYMFEKSINFPGLIWEFSLDGFIWLIAMKLLFWVVGALFGLLCGLLGIIVAILISPFTYPFSLVSYLKEQRI